MNLPFRIRIFYLLASVENVRNKCVDRALHNCTAASYDLKYGIEPDQAERKCSPKPTDYENPYLTENNAGQRKAEDGLLSDSASYISSCVEKF